MTKEYLDILSITVDGSGYLHDGCYYATLFDVLATGIMGFCGCGDPEGALGYTLQLFDKFYAKKAHEYKPAPEPGNAEYFFLYAVSELGLTEHGSAVPGWLNEKGEAFISLAETTLKEGE